MTSPVSVVVVHFHSRGDIVGLAADLRVQDHTALDVVIVECGADGSVPDSLAALGDVPVTVLDPGANLGYCGGNNLAIAKRPVRGDVLIVNPDVRLPDPTTISALQRELHADPALAAVGPVIRTPEGLVEHAGSTIDHARGLALHTRTSLPDWPRDLSREREQVPWLNGCCWLLAADALEQVGGLDERFFLFFEEVDWALRARATGRCLAIVAATSVRHTRSASFGESQKGSYYFWRNNFLLFRTHDGLGRWTIAWLGRLLRFALAPRHLRTGAGANALWGGLDAVRGRTGPRPGRGRA